MFGQLRLDDIGYTRVNRISTNVGETPSTTTSRFTLHVLVKYRGTTLWHE